MTDNADDQPETSGGPESTAAGGNRVSSRSLLFVVASLALALACVVLVLKYFTVGEMPELTEARLDAAEKIWQENAPPAYDMEIEIRGAQPGIVHIEIRSNAVTAMTRDGQTPPERTWDVWTVPGMFDTLEREMVMAENPEREMDASVGTKIRLYGEFDSKLGFPWRFHRYVSSGGPEVYWRVTQFSPR